MEQCLDFAATSSTSFLAYLQQKRGGGHHRLHLCTAYPGPREISFKTNENEWIIVEIFLPELNERFEICFDEVKFLEQPLATEYSKGKNIVLDVLVSDDYLTLPILPPKLHDLPLNECNLKCLGCDSILAIPHPEYVVEDEAAEEIMEAAMGCCRCCCSTAATKCAHLRPSDTGKILIDDGIVLITEKYLFEGSYRIQASRIQCIKCASNESDNEYFGFRRNRSNYIEIIPIKADFFDENNQSLLRKSYKCWGSYFASLLITTGLQSYITVIDGCNNPKIQLGYFFRRKLWLGDKSTVKNVTALCLFYTENLQFTNQKSTPKVRLPVAIIKLLKDYLKRSHGFYKTFNVGCGDWKSAFLCLDCGNSCLLNENLKII